MSRLTIRRSLGAAVAVALTLGGALAAPASAAPTATPATSSGDWLVAQLQHGLVHNDQYDVDDYGLSADTAFALQALGGHSDKVTRISARLAGHVASWTTGADFGSDDVYAGPTAKALVLATTTKADPRDFGGVDLVQQLTALEVRQAPDKGRIADRSASGDYANTIAQALAYEGLKKAHVRGTATVLAFLLQQQCSGGGFRLDFAPMGAPTQGCRAAATSTPDTDTTALVVTALRATRQSARTKTAVKHAVTWLRKAQRGNGSFGGGPSTGASNTNSTGLAGAVLGDVGACSAAKRAARWVARFQVTGAQGKGSPLRREKGAIAYDAGAFKAAGRDGITRATRDQWRRATTQAAPVLRFVDGCR